MGEPLGNRSRAAREECGQPSALRDLPLTLREGHAGAGGEPAAIGLAGYSSRREPPCGPADATGGATAGKGASLTSCRLKQRLATYWILAGALLLPLRY